MAEGKIYGSFFAAIPTWLLDSDISDRAIRLFAKLNRYAGSDGCCNPGRQRLAEELFTSKDSIDRAKAELIKVGALESQPVFGPKGDQTSNDYVLHFDAPVRPRGRTVAPTPLGKGAAQKRARVKESQNPSQQEKTSSPPVEDSPRTSAAPKAPTSDSAEAVPKRRKRSLPADFALTASMREWAVNDWAVRKVTGIDVEREFEQFRDYHSANGSTMVDWVAAWRTWARRARGTYSNYGKVDRTNRNPANVAPRGGEMKVHVPAGVLRRRAERAAAAAAKAGV